MVAAMEAQDAPPGGAPAAPAPPAKVMLLLRLGGSPRYQEIARVVQQTRLFQGLVDHVNRVVPLEKNLPVLFEECGYVNAEYDPQADRIRVCAELLETFAMAFSDLPQPAEREQALRGAAFFTLAHELGHALIRRMNVPISGGEEDSADRFATLLLRQMGDDGVNATLNAAQWMLWMSEHRDPSAPVPFWDEHQLDEQRFYNIVCWAYGSEPFRHVNLVSSGILPPERAARCGDEFQQMRRSWKQLLGTRLAQEL